MLFLISRIIAKKVAESGLSGDVHALRESAPSNAGRAMPTVSAEGALPRHPPVDIAAIERHLAFPKPSGRRAFPSTVPMTMTRWS